MKVLGGTKSKITKDENSENMLHLEITAAVLIHCNIALFRFVPNKSFGPLLDISQKKFIFLKSFKP